MDLDEVIYILVGSTFGLTLRLFLQNLFRKKIVFYYKNSLIVNVLASLFLGIFVVLSPNNNIFLLIYVGFLGSLSTFSSFIYHLFNLIQKRKYLSSLIYYIQVMILSCLFFCLGYFITSIIES